MISARLSHFILLAVVVFRLECTALTPSRSIHLSPLMTSTLHPSVGISFSTQQQQQQQHDHSLSIKHTLLRMKDDNDDDDKEQEEEEEELDEPMTEEESSRKVFQRLDLPRRIGEAINSVAVLFVVCGLLLNVCGYSYVVKDNYMLTIDTLENRQFQRELRKSTKESARDMRAVAPTNSQSAATRRLSNTESLDK